MQHKNAKQKFEGTFKEYTNFSLTDEEMAAIAPLDIGHSEIVNYFAPNFVRALHGRFAR